MYKSEIEFFNLKKIKSKIEIKILNKFFTRCSVKLKKIPIKAIIEGCIKINIKFKKNFYILFYLKLL